MNFNLILFLTQSISNILIILVVPESISKNFLGSYALSNAIFSLFFVYLFSSKFKEYNLKIIVLILILLSLCAIFSNDVTLQAVGYTMFVLSTDYIISQLSPVKWIKMIRIFVVITSLILLLDFQFSDILKMRIIAVLPLLIIIVYKNKAIERLRINNGPLYFAAVYFSYSLMLYLLTFIPLNVQQFKEWYLVLQVALAIQLKFIDYKTRPNSQITMSISNISKFISFGLILVVFARNHSFIALSLGFAGMIGLVLTEKYLIQHD